MYMWINVSFRKGSTATTTRRKKCSFNAKYGSFLMKNTERNETKIELLKYFNPLSIRPSDFKLSWYWYSSPLMALLCYGKDIRYINKKATLVSASEDLLKQPLLARMSLNRMFKTFRNYCSMYIFISLFVCCCFRHFR